MSSTESTPPSSFCNLSDLAKFYLDKSTGDQRANIATGTKFTIPKLGGLGLLKTDANLTPHQMSLQKIINKKVQISNVEPNTQQESHVSPLDSNQFIVDLSTALKTDDIPIITPVETTKVDLFTPSFVDCETTIKTISLPKPVFCEIDLSHILSQNVKKFTKFVSTFGRTLCQRYQNKSMVTVQHGFVRKHKILPYTFHKPSPDDVVLQFTNRTKQTS